MTTALEKFAEALEDLLNETRADCVAEAQAAIRGQAYVRRVLRPSDSFLKAMRELRGEPATKKIKEPMDDDRLMASVKAFLSRNPTSGSEAIGKHLGVDAITLRASLNKMIQAGVIRKHGAARGTKYELA